MSIENPCKECIVTMMCETPCDKLKYYLTSRVPFRIHNKEYVDAILKWIRLSQLRINVHHVRVKFYHDIDQRPKYYIGISNGKITHRGPNEPRNELRNYPKGMSINTHQYIDSRVELKVFYTGTKERIGHGSWSKFTW